MSFNIEELRDLAKTYEDSLMLEKLTATEVTVVVALLQARIMRRVYRVGSLGVESPIIPTIPSSTPVPAQVPQKPKAIKYDPLYDPAPPMDVEAPPAPEIPTGRILAKANTACVCSGCHKVVYVTNRDIPDNCKISFFRESFTPTTGVPELPLTAEIENIDGNISTDCPICLSVKSLYLIGKSNTTIATI